ncbi:MAG: hypothetical protein R3288_09185 [Woeseiaceae bacterium]|nr:hypothetical protein [Woeseiaceae bacterium]
MWNKTLLRGALIALTSAGLLVACNKDSASDDFAAGDGILRFVPADTPYLFASGEPLPDDVLDKFEPKVDDLLQAYQVVLRELVRTMLAKNDSDMDADEIQRVSAVVDELVTLLSIEGLRGAGIERDSAVAFYGNGLLPVLRFELSDAARFEAAIARIEEAAGEKLELATVDGHSYRVVGDDEGKLAIATIDNNAIFTFIPANFDEAATKSLLGLTPPAGSIADTDTLSDIAATYDYSDHYIGFIDVRRIASTFIDGPAGLDVPLLASSEFDASRISDVCKREIRDVVNVAPRAVFGYDEIDTDRMSGSFVIELRPDIATGLSSIAAEVPGLGRDAGGLLSMGVSFNLLALREFYEARLDAMETDPFECEYFADLQAGVAKGREALNQPVPPFVYGLRGFNAVVDDVTGFDLANEQPPESVDASVLLALDDAQTMLAMGAMFSPELAQLNLQPDGNPVRVELPQLAALGQVVYAAMLEDAIAVSVGADAESRVKAVLTAASVAPPPVFSMSMDAGRYYSLIADGMMLEDDDEEVRLSPEGRAALRDAMLAIGDLYDRMSFDIRFTDRGLEMDSVVTLKD